VVLAIQVVHALEPLIAVSALQDERPGHHAPEEHSIVHELAAYHVARKLLEVKTAVRHVLCNNATVEVNEDLGLGAYKFVLALEREELVAVSATLEHVTTVRRLEEQV